MTSNEFYNVLMKDVDYILNGGFVVNTDAFMQTMSYASEQYEAVLQKATSLEEQNKELQENIGLTMNLSESILQELNSERGIKEYLIKSFKEQTQGLQSLLDLKQQEISVLESKVVELEANEEKLKREWYVMGSNDNFKALLDSGAIQQ